MKTSVIIQGIFRDRYPGQFPRILMRFEGRAVVFRGPRRTITTAIRRSPRSISTSTAILFVRGQPVRSAIPGGARGREHAAAGRPHQARHPVPALHRPTAANPATSGSPSILNATPEGRCRRRPCDPQGPATWSGSTSTKAAPNILISDEELKRASRRNSRPKGRLPLSGQPDALAGSSIAQPSAQAGHRRMPGARDAPYHGQSPAWSGVARDNH